MSKRSTSLPIALPEGAAPASAHELLGDAPRALEALLDTLGTAFDSGVEHVHVEPSDAGWRLRLRHDDALEGQVLPVGHALPDALARLGPDNRAFTLPLGGERQLVEIVTRRTTRGASYLLTLHGSALAPRRLDALGLDPRPLASLRARLGSTRNGWLPVGTCSTVDGAIVVRAIAQELVSPERALLCLESAPHPPLTGVLQIDIAGALPEPLAPDTDVVLVASSPPDAALASLAPRAAQDLLVVQRTTARRPSETLSRLLALGVTPAWIALTVPAILMRHRLRLLCPHCRVRDARPGAERLPGTDAGPGIVDVAAWLESSLATRYRRGSGCEHCHGSAHAGVRDLSVIVTLEEAVRSALLANETARAFALVDASSDLVTRLPALVGAGEIAADEATRHLIPRR